MKPAEKEVLRAGLRSYYIGAIARATMVLEDTRRMMHLLRDEEKLVYGVLSDWSSFYGLARAQVMVLRRAKETLRAVSESNYIYEWLDERHGTDDDPRWKDVTDDSLVLWEGKPTTWGALAGNEKMECDFRRDGVLVGAFVFGHEMATFDDEDEYRRDPLEHLP